MERSSRKQLTGKVTSTKMEKTITVSVDSYIKHPLYGKRFKKTRKFHAHDENSEAKLGDIVLIAETRPMSKMKKFRLKEVLETAKDGE